MKLGELVRKLRNNKGYSLSKLADESSLDKSYISKLENNKIDNPSRDALERITQALEVDKKIEEEIMFLGGYLTDDAAQRLLEESINERITSHLSSEPELLEFWEIFQNRKDLQLLFKGLSKMSKDDVIDFAKIASVLDKGKDKPLHKVLSEIEKLN